MASVRAVQSEASLRGARIVATSVDGRSHQARSGADGRFAIALPGPADYAVAVTTAGYAPAHLTVTTPLVVAVERALPGNRPRLVDPEWLERMAPLARQVTVNEGAVAAVELTVRPLPAE